MLYLTLYAEEFSDRISLSISSSKLDQSEIFCSNSSKKLNTLRSETIKTFEGNDGWELTDRAKQYIDNLWLSPDSLKHDDALAFISQKTGNKDFQNLASIQDDFFKFYDCEISGWKDEQNDREEWEVITEISEAWDLFVKSSDYLPIYEPGMIVSIGDGSLWQILDVRSANWGIEVCDLKPVFRWHNGQECIANHEQYITVSTEEICAIVSDIPTDENVKQLSIFEQENKTMISEFVDFRVSKFFDLIVDPEYGRERAIKGLDHWAHQNSYRLSDEDKRYIDDAIARATKQEENKPMTIKTKTEETPIEIDVETREIEQIKEQTRSELPTVLPWKHNDFKTAYVIDDYPYGRTLRCKKAVWIETADKGQKKGQMRVCYKTTNPKRSGEVWNSAHNGQYTDLMFLYVDPETGYLRETGISTYSPDSIAKFKTRWYALLDSEQKEAVDELEKVSIALNKVWENVTFVKTVLDPCGAFSDSDEETQEAPQDTPETVEPETIAPTTEVQETAIAQAVPSGSENWEAIDSRWDHTPTNVETTEETQETVADLLADVGLGTDTLEASGIEVKPEMIEPDRVEQPTETPIATDETEIQGTAIEESVAAPTEQPTETPIAPTEEKNNLIQFPVKETEPAIAPTEAVTEVSPIAEVVEKIKAEVKKGFYTGWQQNIIKQRAIKIAVKDLLIPVMPDDAQRELAARAIAWADPDTIDIADIIANPPEEKQVIQWVRVKPSEMALALSSAETVDRLYRALQKSDPALAGQLFVEESLEIPATPKPIAAQEQPVKTPEIVAHTPKGTTQATAPAAAPQPKPERQKVDTLKQPRQPKPKTSDNSSGLTPSQKLEELHQLKADVDAKGKKVVAEERGYSDTSTINANLIGLSVLEQSTEVKEWFLSGSISWSDVRETRKQINKIGLKGVIEQLRQKVQKAS